MLPSLDATYSREQNEIRGQWQPGWSMMLVLSVPLFNGLSSYSDYRSQEQRKHEAEFQIEQLRRDQLNQQKVDQDNFRLALQTALSREKTLTTAQKLLKANLNRFKAGRLDANDLTVERTRETRASIQEIEGWAQAHLALLRLFHSFGESVQDL
jgi:outer membrane protein TolC